ncbi:MAG: DUF507 family protein [Nitrospirae bacterium]|nr:DUF507 family protein [Nitrospirota bacterium]
MKLSDDKVSHLSHVILSGLKARKTVTPLTEDSAIRREIKNIINRELKLSEGIDRKVSAKLMSYTKKIIEGSPEWEVLYQKFYNEEMSKLGRND